MKLKGIVLAVILSLASIMMPFNVYADSITTSNINGISVVLDEVTFIENKTWTISGGTLTLPRSYYNYNAEIQFDKSYLGYVDITINYSYFARNDTGMTNFSGTKVQKVFVNGDKANLAFGFIANSSTDPLTYSSISYTLNSSDLIEYGLISDIETIIDILQENQDIITDIYSELQKVVTNTSLANTYLEKLTQLKQWHVPFESFSYVYSLLNKYPNKVINTQNIYYFDYPVFNLNNGDEVINYTLNTSNQYLELILGINKNISSSTTFKNFFTSSEEYIVKDFTSLNISYGVSTVDSYIRIIKLKISTNGNSNIPFQLFVNSDTKIIPIYLKRSNQTINVSTDFALIFGLSNQLLDDIHIIVQGTSQSNTAASDLESSNDQMADDMDDLATIESGYNQQFNDQLQSIDFTSPIQNNAGILPAANFVITIFNGLINNNPFSVLIIIVCILLIGKKVIGK